MKTKKGQFMMISSVVIGLIVISVAGTISEVQSREFQNPDTAYQLESMKDEAGKIDITRIKERDNYKKLVNLLSYKTDTTYWDTKQCFNITLQTTRQRLQLNCIS